jgi:plastocyanin
MPSVRLRRIRFRPALGLLAVAGVLACGGSNGTSPPRPGLTTVLVVSSPSNQFQPATVNISSGDTVKWAWSSGSMGHNIISTGSPGFQSKGNDVPGFGSLGTDYFDYPTSHQVIFTTPGTYGYYCSLHGTSAITGMSGRVVVSP